MKNISVEIAAKIMGKKQQFVRMGLQTGVLPFGCCVRQDGAKRSSYYISPSKFADFVGMSIEDVENYANADNM